MENLAKIVISILFAILFLSDGSLAGTYSGGSGTSTSPYLIATAADINTLGSTSADWSKYFKMTADINMAGFADTKYKTIGNSTTNFTGTFDGNEHVIKNLTYTTSDTYYTGIFGYAANATIKNLGVEDVNLSVVYGSHGGLAGYTSHCVISNCYSTGKVAISLSAGSSDRVGGLIGYQDYCTINDCHSSVAVTSGSISVGGLVGSQNYGTIKNCYSTGPITCYYTSSGYPYAGGLVGWQTYGNIVDCYSTGNVTSLSAYGMVGGLAGYCTNSRITNSYATGTVTGKSYVGGLVGYNLETIIKNCYAAGAVSGGTYTYRIGGLAGFNSSSSNLQNCFWDKETSLCSSGVVENSSSGVTGKTTAEMKLLSTFSSAGWDIGDIYGADTTTWIMMPDGQDYPKLNFIFCTDCSAAITLSGSGTESDPYQIYSAEDFAALGNYCSAWDKYIILMADIDLDGYAVMPIGNAFVKFTGNFNGQGFVVRNVTMNSPDKNYVGLFGRVNDGGVIADLGVEDINIAGKEFVGGLVGFNSGGEISNCYTTGYAELNSSSFAGGLVGFSLRGTISDCNSTVNIRGSGAAIGGLAGYNGKRNVISKCHAAGWIIDVNSDRFNSSAGGLVGNNFGTIQNSSADSNITATFNSSSAYFYLGGIAGDNSDGNIFSCYATGDISVTSNPSTALINAGGVTGFNIQGDVNDCYATGQITFDCDSDSKYLVGGVAGGNIGKTINRCYSTCAIGSGEADYCVGGAVGLNFDGFVSGCFWDIQTSGKTISGGGKGLTTEQMKAMLIYQNAGWADNGWVMNDGVDCPRLEWENTAGVAIPAEQAPPLTGSGTEADPYQVWTVADFAYLSWYKSIIDKHIILMADIDLENVRIHPIGENEPFTGSFDGNGYIIENVSIYEPTNNYVGLFRRVGTGGVIQNLDVRHISIVGGNYVGGLAGTNEGGTISSCGTTGTVDGFVCVGGLIGQNDGTVDQCYSKADTTVWDGLTSCVGGLIGQSGNSITSCYATGDVTCHYSTNSYAGGLVGRDYPCSSIWNSYSAGYISATGKNLYTGGLLGYISSNSYQPLHSRIIYYYARYSYWDKETSGMTTSAGSSTSPSTGVVAKTTAQMKTLSLGTTLWSYCSGTNYPKLAWQRLLAGDFGCPDGVDMYDLAVLTDQWLYAKLKYDLYQADNLNIVNFLDWNVFANSWDGNYVELANFVSEWLVSSTYSTDSTSDINGDGIVNMLDFATFAENWMIDYE